MESICLLWPGTAGQNPVDFSDCAGDLELGELAAILYSCFPGMSSAQALAATNSLATSDPDVLAFRRACIGDLLEHPKLIDTLETCLDDIRELTVCSAGIRENAQGLANGGGMSGFKETLDKLERLFGSRSNLIDENDLDNYCGQLFRATIFSYRMARAYTALLTRLKTALEEANCSSEAMRRLKHWVEQVCKEDEVEKSISVLEKLSGGWNGVGSFACDILVDQSFNITGMELTGIRPAPYARAGLTARRAGEDADGLSRLSEFPQGGASTRFQECLITELGASMRGELYHLRDAVCRLPIHAVPILRQLGEEIPFYIAAARFCLRLREKGAEVCCPVESGDCLIDASGAYPISALLIHGQKPAANDIRLPRGGSISFITGSNSSGKTTLLITAGQLLWLYQLGCWLPCRRAAMHTADGVYTLFASSESEDGSDSRMGVEVQKLSSFRDRITKDSLILLNEPLTSTSANEGISLSIELLRDLIQKGISGMMVTHYNEIYAMLRTRLIEDGEGLEDRLVSYVMEVDWDEAGNMVYPYRLRQRDPGRSSHADEIIRRVGADLSSMLKTMAASGLDVHPESECWSRLHTAQEV